MMHERGLVQERERDEERAEHKSLLSAVLQQGHGQHHRIQTDEKRARDHRIGLLLLLIVVLLWTSSSVITQRVLVDTSFQSPLLLTYFNSSLFSLLFFIPLLRKCAGRDNCAQQPNRLAQSQVRILALKLFLLWNAMAFLCNWSLSRTSVSSNTMLSTTSPLFTLFFSLRLVPGTRLLLSSVLGVFLTIVGASCVSLEDANHGPNSTIEGDIAALASALLYGLYSPLLKVQAKSDAHMDTSTFFGWMGVFSLLLLMPLLLLANYSGLCPLMLPGPDAFIGLMLNGLINLCSDYLWARSILLTTPLIAAVGVAMMTPASILADWFFNQRHFAPLYFFGSFLTIAGFVCTNLDLQPKDLQQNTELHREPSSSSSST